MKNLKRIAGFLLCLTLICALPATACAAVSDTGFADVDADAWYAEAVVYCRDNQVMGGVTTTSFAPDATMTRAMLATVLYRVAGEPAVSGSDSFTDTESGTWYSNAALWASEQGLVTGYGNGLFGTNDPVTREQIAAILWRYAGSPTAAAGAAFADGAAISPWAQTAVAWARGNGIINGKGGNVFDPQGNATRAEVAAILMNYAQGGESTPADGRNILVAYFSATGNTKAIAGHIAETLDADVYEIVAQDDYSAADLNYNDSASRTTSEQNDPAARPAISGGVEDMAGYDAVFIGYPIWHGQAPRIISTFLESYDFSGKTIVPFCTSGGSGLGSSATNLQALAPDADWLTGQRFSGGASRSTVESWVTGLELPEASAQAQTQAQDNAIIYAHIGANVLEIEPADNSSATALLELLVQGDVTVDMHDYGNFEKVGELGTELPTNDVNITTQAGDVILYQGNNIVIYYDTNTWNFTRLGKVVNVPADELKEILGEGNVTVTFSLER